MFKVLNARRTSPALALQPTATAAGCSLWTELCIRRAYSKQMGWISTHYTTPITTLVLHNCSINWRDLLLMLSEFENLSTLSDCPDMYFWDYATFAEGIKENEEIADNANFQELSTRLGFSENVTHTLENLKHVHIHRCQVSNCVLYLKILLLHCVRLETLEITSDQRVSFGGGGLHALGEVFVQFYFYLGQLIQANANSLTSLSFPYKSQYPSTEFRVFDDQPGNPFDMFLNYVTEHNWRAVIQPRNLASLTLQFPAIRIEETAFQQRLQPFLSAWTSTAAASLKSLTFGFVYLEPSKDRMLIDSIPRSPSVESTNFGVWLMDSDGLPLIENVFQHVKYVSIQLSTPLSVELKDILMLDEDETGADEVIGNPKYAQVTELQFFSKAANFRNLNLQLMIPHFPNLTHLNLVDFNIRVDRIHSSESPATVEDEDLQKIFRCLCQLTLLQLAGNLVYLTDVGMTGLKHAACKRMLKRDVFEKVEGDLDGFSFSALRKLHTLILSGVGVKITDVSAYFAFNNMPALKKLHMYGAHQITSAGKDRLIRIFSTSRNCSLQI